MQGRAGQSSPERGRPSDRAAASPHAVSRASAARALERLAGWWRASRWRWPVMTATAALWMGLLASPWMQLAVRSDDSWPHHRLFVIDKTRRPARGEFAAFVMTPQLARRVQPPLERPYVRIGALWVKRVVGVEGDRIERRPMPDGAVQILINGHPVGAALPRDRFGRPIRAAELPAIIPPGQAYVALEHPRSFDSRYFGLVALDDLRGTVLPMW